MHLPGIGYATERRLWASGITRWEEFFDARDEAPVGPVRQRRLQEGLATSLEELDRGNHAFFRRRLPHREFWRAFGEFRDSVAYLDIETTGMEADRDVVTLIGLYDGRRTRHYYGDELDRFPHDAEDFRVLVTFNGSNFDLPFLRRTFPGLRFHQIHIDLRYLFHRLGMRGGLKRIEKRLRLERSPETRDIRGWDAVYLWRRHQQGDAEALEILLRYNAEDVEHLEPLLEIAYEGLRGRCMGDEFRTYSLRDTQGAAPDR